jgi:uncharacterized membrane protein YkoI
VKKKTMWISGAAIAAVLVLGGTGTALAITEPWDHDDDDRGTQLVDDLGQSGAGQAEGASDPENAPISDDDRSAASDAALSEVAGGSVTDVERSDDPDHAWEVDLTSPDGVETEVELDESFSVVRVQQGD